LLLEILEEHHRELFREIARTDHRQFRSVLKNEELLDSMINGLEILEPGEAARPSA
jgi:hypothetical protein